MGLSTALGAVAHDAMHRLPGVPDHARKDQLNAARRHRALHNRPLRNRPLRSPDGHHERPARVLVGWQAWIGRRFGQGQR
jgi:hypothetical protein